MTYTAAQRNRFANSMETYEAMLTELEETRERDATGREAMASRNARLCDLCNRPLYDGDPYQLDSDFYGLVATHNHCSDAIGTWRAVFGAHKLWCHIDGCDRGPVNPFEGARR